jgi:transposase
MRTAPATLPTDPQALAQLCLSAFETIARLEKELAWHKRQAFGRKADVVPPPPFALDLFASEALPAITSVPAASMAAEAAAIETITYARRKPGHGRKAFSAHLPRVIEVVEPKDEERLCACCGAPKEKIGEDACEVLEHIPQKLFVRRIVRPRYACPRHAEEGVVQAAPPARFIPKGNVGEGLLAEVLLSKYVNHQPLSRQERNFRRLGVEISTSTMVSWMEAATAKLSPIVEAMRAGIVSGRIAYSDDTSLPVLREDKPGAAHRGYLWVYSDGKAAVVFDYTSGRDRAGPVAFLLRCALIRARAGAATGK